MFCFYVDDVVKKLELYGMLGSKWVSGCYIGCMYADDGILMSCAPSVLCDLQKLVNYCVDEFSNYCVVYQLSMLLNVR